MGTSYVQHWETSILVAKSTVLHSQQLPPVQRWSERNVALCSERAILSDLENYMDQLLNLIAHNQMTQHELISQIGMSQTPLNSPRPRANFQTRGKEKYHVRRGELKIGMRSIPTDSNATMLSQDHQEGIQDHLQVKLGKMETLVHRQTRG